MFESVARMRFRCSLPRNSRIGKTTSVLKISNSVSGEVQDAGNANPDNDFRFDALLGGSPGGYIFNLKTSGLTTGAYELRFVIDGGSTVYAAPFQVK